VKKKHWEIDDKEEKNEGEITKGITKRGKMKKKHWEN